MEMGASEDGGIGLDCSVGTIVWVRRRNGSWWPGRILGPEELSASHLMSPRSGTPVKLLGREDASVDWYNLEKSKRVKAFRCGEFDACIERAEASQGVPIKKREKYARREDAILHALELEKQQLTRKHYKFGSSSTVVNHNSGGLKKEFNNISPGLYMRNDETAHRKFVNPKAQVLPRRSDLLPEEMSGGQPLHTQNGKNDKELHCQDDNSEATPRMRGLQDFGLQIAPSKRKLSTSINCEVARKSVLVDNHVHVLPGVGHGMGSVTNVGSAKSSLAFKRKRSQGGPTEESLVKRRDRRRPLVQVLQSSAKLPLSQSLQFNPNEASILAQEEKENMGAICRAKRSRCLYQPADSSDCLDHTGYTSDQLTLSPNHSGYSNGLHQPGSLLEEETSSGLIEEDDSDSSDRGCMGLDNDMEEETTLLQDAKSVPRARFPGRYDRDSSSAFCNEENLGTLSNNNYETSLVNYRSHLNCHEQSAGTSADVGVSKWHMKGKRNIRNLTRRPMEVLDGKDSVMSEVKCNGSVNGTAHENKGSIFKMGRERASGQGYYLKDVELGYGYDEDDFFEKDLENDLVGFGNHSYPSMLKAPSIDCSNSVINDSDEDSHEMLSSGWEADGPPPMARRTYWGEPDEFFDAPYLHPHNVRMEPMLVDVNLKVQASYQGEHVPLVSLMSRLNGKAIIGHPVQIEILEDGSSDLQLPRNGLGEDKTGLGENTAPPPVWRTGRRTAMQRVPRSHPTPSTLEGEDIHPIRLSDLERKPLFKKPFTVPKSQAKSKKKNSHHHRSMMSGKSHKKLSKKASLSSQKTRTLSSIATEQKRSGSNVNGKLAKKDSILDDLIKADSSMPLVACVPLKVVFSRILEAVGRPASSSRGVVISLPERNPS